MVVDTLAEPGQVVSAGQPVVQLARAGLREAVVHLPETLRPSVGSVAQMTLYGTDIQALPATLRLLSNEADPLTCTFETRYVRKAQLASAPLGSAVTLTVAEGKSSEQLLQQPIVAIFGPGKGPDVWGISGIPTGGAPTRRTYHCRAGPQRFQ